MPVARPRSSQGKQKSPTAETMRLGFLAFWENDFGIIVASTVGSVANTSPRRKEFIVCLHCLSSEQFGHRV